jgi:hypothetical protein
MNAGLVVGIGSRGMGHGKISCGYRGSPEGREIRFAEGRQPNGPDVPRQSPGEATVLQTGNGTTFEQI